MRLPWHQRVWERLITMRERLPHGLLLTGQQGLGKLAFARRLSQALLCRQPGPDGDACDECDACQQYAAGAHPDYSEVRIPEDKTRILIEQVRDLIQRLMLTSGHGHRIAVIEPADAMTREAQNSLLKILEEPGADTLIILVTARPGFLAATVRSRCQRHDIVAPTPEQACQWLQAQGIDNPLPALAMARGAPLAALAFGDRDIAAWRQGLMDDFLALATGHSDPLTLAERWAGDDPDLAIDWLETVLMDMIRLRSGSNPPALANPDLCNDLKPLAKQLDLEELYRHLERIASARRLLQGTVANQTALEEVLIPWRNRRTKKA